MPFRTARRAALIAAALTLALAADQAEADPGFAAVAPVLDRLGCPSDDAQARAAVRCFNTLFDRPRGAGLDAASRRALLAHRRPGLARAAIVEGIASMLRGGPPAPAPAAPVLDARPVSGGPPVMAALVQALGAAGAE